MAGGPRAGIDIRGALPADAAEIGALLGAAPRQLAERLEQVAQAPGAAALVATGWNGAVIGVVALQWGPGLAADRPAARLTTLVVAEAERRSGVGRLLLKAAAQSARQAGCDQLELAAPADAAAVQGFAAALGFVPAGGLLTRPLRKRAGPG
jgi:aminoglycoside 6'-N-acetyltransferase I